MLSPLCLTNEFGCKQVRSDAEVFIRSVSYHLSRAYQTFGARMVRKLDLMNLRWYLPKRTVLAIMSFEAPERS